jgi:hypothetical protein
LHPGTRHHWELVDTVFPPVKFRCGLVVMGSKMKSFCVLPLVLMNIDETDMDHGVVWLLPIVQKISLKL